MAYAQIAQQTFDFDREDGTTRQYRYTFEKKDGTVQSYNVPKANDTVIKAGDRTDTPNKPLVLHEASFTLKGVDEPLIEEIANAGLRDLRVTIEDVATGDIPFEGFVMPEFTSPRKLYDDMQVIKVRCYGGLADLAERTVQQNTHTIHGLAEEISTVIELERELDLYTSLRHTNQPSDTDLPNTIRFNERIATADNFAGTFRDAVRKSLLGLGLRVFQRNGRLVFADIYDLYVNRGSVKKFQSNGDGTYSQTTEDNVIPIGKSKVIKEEDQQDVARDIKPLEPVRSYQHRHSNGIHRDMASFTEINNLQLSDGNEQVEELDRGLMLSGDEVGVRVEGQVEGNNEDLSGTSQWLRIELHEEGTGAIWYLNPGGVGGDDKWVEGTVHHFEQNFTFTTLEPNPNQSVDISIDRKLPPIPDDIDVARLKIVPEAYFDVSGDIWNQFDVVDVRGVNYADDGAGVTLVQEAKSGHEMGQTVQGDTFLGDLNQHSTNSTYAYYDETNWNATEQWVSATGNDGITRVVADRHGKVIVGKGDEYKIRVRDTQISADMLSVFEVENNEGGTDICLPLQIRLNIDSGYYEILLRQVFDGITSTEEYFVSGLTATVETQDEVVSGSTGSGNPSSPNGGTSNHGDLTGLDDPADHPWAVQTDLGNINWSNVDKDQFREDAGLQIGTNVQAHSAVLDNVVANDGSAGLNIGSLAIDGDDLFSLFYTEQEINSFFDLYYSKADLTDGQVKLHLNSIDIDTDIEHNGSRVIGFVGDEITFYNDINVQGTINYVNETNLEVEDKTITVNKGGTAQSALGAGLIVEMPDSPNKTLLWDNGWSLNGNNIWNDGRGDNLAGDNLLWTGTQLNAIDTNTTYSASGDGLDLNDTVFSHADTSIQGNINTTGANFIDVVELDDFGHVTQINTREMTTADIGAASADQLYNSWSLTDSTNTLVVGSGQTVTVAGSGATSVDLSGNTLTISSTDNDTNTNFYLDTLSFDSDTGELTATLNGTTTTPSTNLDNRYALENHIHNYDNYDHWGIQADGGTVLDVNSDDTINFAGLGAASVSRDGNTIQITSADTNLTEQEITNMGFIQSYPVDSVFGEIGAVTVSDIPIGAGLTLVSSQLTVNSNTDLSYFNNDLTASDVGAASDSHGHNPATTSSAGFMSSSDKSKLNGIESNAEVNAVDSVNGYTGTVSLTASDVNAAPDNHTHGYGDLPMSSTDASNWTDAYDHSNDTLGNPHDISYSDIGDLPSHTHSASEVDAVSATNGGTFGGNVTADNFILSSDKRVKENNELIDQSLSTLMNIPVRSYLKKGEFEIGYFAQDVREFYPNLVVDGSDGYLTLKQHSMTALNTRAIQELEENKAEQERVQQLESKVHELEEEIERLRNS